MGNLTPLIDKKLEAKAISTLQKDLRACYPSRWSVVDSRVGTFLDSYIRLSNTYKKPLKGNVQFYASQLSANFMASNDLAADFMNSLSRCIANGAIPPNPLSDVVGWARGSAVQAAPIAAEKAAAPPSLLDKVLHTGSGVVSSWATAYKFLPWVLILGGGAFVWFTYGAPQRNAIKKATRS